MSPADTPDFDSMSPEEVMAWMESLAKRQGANAEGFTTEADMDIAEVDPSTVHIDEPGYVPFGEAPPPKPAAAAAPKPESEPEPEAEIEDEPEPQVAGMDWLESLAADQGVGFPDMDLSALSAELEQVEEAEEAPVAATNPMDWLEDMAEDQGIEFEDEGDTAAIETLSDAEMAAIDDPLAAGIDPMLWLESLARRQGANQEELTTAADMDVPTPEGYEDTGPGYQEFSVEHDPSARAPVEESSDPAAWLESITTAADSSEMPEIDEGEEELVFDGPMTDEQIQQALNSGVEIPPEQMEAFLARQLERQLTGGDVPMDPGEDYDPDAPPVPAEIPEWLLDQVQQPGEDSETSAEAVDFELELEDEAEQPPALVEEILEPPDVEAELPDWLKDDQGDSTQLELESIFELDTEDSGAIVDETDPWVQAFTEEANTDPDAIPEWYEQNLNDPQRIAAVEQQIGAEPSDSALEEADLPTESRLPEGEADDMPEWAAGTTAPVEAEAPVADWLADTEPSLETGEIPNWLAESEVDVQPEEIPTWLLDTVETEEVFGEDLIVSEAAPPEPPAAPAPTPAPAPAAPQPAAPPPPAEVEGLLENAREKVGSGDLDGSFVDYERIIRANAALDHVAADLQEMLNGEEKNPAVYRLLGDCLMRQGELQEALNTYRKALNQL